MVEGDQDRVIASKDLIFERGAEADRIKHELRANLSESLFMPVDRRVIGSIVVSWLITLPVGGILAVLFFFPLKGMFS